MSSGYGETSREGGEAPAPKKPGTTRTAKAAERINEGGRPLRGRVCYGRLSQTLREREGVGFHPRQVNDLTRAVDVDPDE